MVSACIAATALAVSRLPGLCCSTSCWLPCFLPRGRAFRTYPSTPAVQQVRLGGPSIWPSGCTAHCYTETYFVYQLVRFMRTGTSRVMRTRLPPLTAAPLQTLYRSSCLHAGTRSGVLRTVPVRIELQLYGPLLYVKLLTNTPCPLFVKLSMDGDTGFAWNKIACAVLISILPQLMRILLCTGYGISAGAVKGF